MVFVDLSLAGKSIRNVDPEGMKPLLAKHEKTYASKACPEAPKGAYDPQRKWGFCVLFQNNLCQEPCPRGKRHKSMPCRVGKKCRDTSCCFQHPTEKHEIVPCRLGEKCHKAGCRFYHLNPKVHDTSPASETLSASSASSKLNTLTIFRDVPLGKHRCEYNCIDFVFMPTTFNLTST